MAYVDFRAVQPSQYVEVAGVTLLCLGSLSLSGMFTYPCMIRVRLMSRAWRANQDIDKTDYFRRACVIPDL